MLFLLYFILFHYEPKLLALIRWNVMAINNLYDPKVWFQEWEWIVMFWQVMPMAMKNLTIVQHRYMLRYAIIWVGGYWPWVRRFESKNHAYLQQTTIALDVIVGYVILHVWCYLSRYYCWRDKMVKHEKIMCVIVCCVIFWKYVDGQVNLYLVVVIIGSCYMDNLQGLPILC